MEQYIPKSALVAEIEKIRAKWFGINNDFADGQKGALTDVLSFLDTLEVKEVDLEEEIELVKGDYEQVDVAWNNDFDYIAKHFFELGLNASNLLPLTWEDIKTIQNISGKVYAEVAKGKVDFYLIFPTEQSFLEEVLKRFKAQKGDKVLIVKED